MNTQRVAISIFAFAILIIVGCGEFSDTPQGTRRDGTMPSPFGLAAAGASPVSVFGVWHAGNDYCTWGTVRSMTEFDSKNHWIIDRGDGSGLPSVNLVALSFVDPMELLNKSNAGRAINGIPKGMTQDVVNYFTGKGIRVMLSVGGITSTAAWNTALATNPAQLAANCADVAQRMGVGIEIDYEEGNTPNLTGLTTFVTTYRSLIPYDSTGANPAARLMIDLASGDRWLIGITRLATSLWLNPSNPVLDYANAMVGGKSSSTSGSEGSWQEHITGKPNYSPAIPPLAPAKLVGSLWLVGRHSLPECVNFTGSIEYAAASYVQNVAPNGAGTSSGMLGYMFWAAECQGTRTACTTSPNSCEGGLGAGAAYFAIPVPMPALRQR